MLFENQLEDAFIRRIKYKLNDFEEELWGETGDNRYTCKNEVTELASKMCQRRRRINCRGTIYLVCGLPGVGCTSVVDETEKEISGKDIASKVLFIEVLQIRSRSQSGKNRITRSEYNKYVSSSDYTCLFTSSDGCRGIVPLQVILFLAEGTDRTVILSGPPEAYTPLIETVPRCDVGVIVITCPQHIVGERFFGGEESNPATPMDSSFRVGPKMESSFRNGPLSPISTGGSFLGEVPSPTHSTFSPGASQVGRGFSFRRYDLEELESIPSDVVLYVSNAGVLFVAVLKLVDIISGVG